MRFLNIDHCDMALVSSVCWLNPQGSTHPKLLISAASPALPTAKRLLWSPFISQIIKPFHNKIWALSPSLQNISHELCQFPFMAMTMSLCRVPCWAKKVSSILEFKVRSVKLKLKKKKSGTSSRICKIFEITRTIYSNSERSEQFLVTECFFNLFLQVFYV